jgi:hypothetical protein
LLFFFFSKDAEGFAGEIGGYRHHLKIRTRSRSHSLVNTQLPLPHSLLSPPDGINLPFPIILNHR